VLLQRVFNECGMKGLSFEVVKECSAVELLSTEQYYLDKFGVEGVLLNTSGSASCGDLMTWHPEKAAVISKRTETIKRNLASMSVAERKLKFGKSGERNGMWGKTHTTEVRASASNRMTGKRYAAGRKMSDEQKAALSLFASQRTGCKNPFFGKTHSEATKKKIAAARRGKSPVNIRSVSAESVVYPSVTAAAAGIGHTPALVIHRIKSRHYPSYFYVS